MSVGRYSIGAVIKVMILTFTHEKDFIASNWVDTFGIGKSTFIIYKVIGKLNSPVNG